MAVDVSRSRKLIWERIRSFASDFKFSLVRESAIFQGPHSPAHIPGAIAKSAVPTRVFLMARKSDKTGRSQANSRAAEQGIAALVRRDITSFFASKAVRETVESVVIAFALAFLFRTFEAEAFVIPTGSMADTLNGRHQNVECPMCEFGYHISASQEVNQATNTRVADVAEGTCSNCGYATCTNLEVGRYFRSHNPGTPPPFDSFGLAHGSNCNSTSGDRILVNKFAYEFQEPDRWDVFVFRFPGQASKNYIKRLVGLPGETLKIEWGDVFTAAYDKDAVHKPDLNYRIQRKPPHKILSMAQMVYDNDHQAKRLTDAGWPRRWQSWSREAAKGVGEWVECDNDLGGFETDGTADEDVWIRYQHIVPTNEDWYRVLHQDERLLDEKPLPTPQLISDAYAYNSSVSYYRRKNRNGEIVWDSRRDRDALPPTGVHWVGDLLLEFELAVNSDDGEAIVELVEGGHFFQLRVDVKTGLAAVSIDGGGEEFGEEDQQSDDTLPQAKTAISGPGDYRIGFANVDDQLAVWINGEQIAFDRPTIYRRLDNRIPQWDATSRRGDLAPVGIGSSGAGLAIRHIKLMRDIYYIASKNNSEPDYLAGPLGPHPNSHRGTPAERSLQLLSSPELWETVYDRMEPIVFPLEKFPHDRRADQFMALGDNSPQSKDSRLWSFKDWDPETGKLLFENKHFVERELLVGKALGIYWPLTHIKLVR